MIKALQMMKTFKILLITAILFSIAFKVNAQTEKGKVFLGGDTKMNFTSQNEKWKYNGEKGDGGTTSVLEFSPQIGFTIIDRLVLGAEVPVTHISYKGESGFKSSSTSYGFAPFVRYYFNSSNNVKPFLHGKAGLGSLNEDDDDSVGMFMYEMAGGIAVFLNEKIALDIDVGYSSTSYSWDSDFKSTYSGIGAGIGISAFL